MSVPNNFAPSPPLMPRIDGVGQWLAPLGLRALLAWEFFEAGREKLRGENWFADIADKFPLPFSLFSADVNWAMATWLELIASVALVLGLGTRYVAFSLWVLTIVAIHAVHWPADWSSVAELWKGFAITDNGFGNYKLPLIYLVMLLPLMLGGAGRFSLDHLIGTRRAPAVAAVADTSAWGLVLFPIGVVLSLLLPFLGSALAIAGMVLLTWPRRTTPVGPPATV